MKKMHELLRKCKSLSTRLGRTSSYRSLRSKSTRLEKGFWSTGASGYKDEEELSVDQETVYVGSLRRRYLINAKLLDHPLVSALVERSTKQSSPAGNGGGSVCVKCEVVIFDHLLWMLENAESDITSDSSLEELAELYAY